MRDSRNAAGPVVTVGAPAWQTFVNGLRQSARRPSADERVRSRTRRPGRFPGPVSVSAPPSPRSAARPASPPPPPPPRHQ
ncbi:DUF397 domain-containing protein [Streptomyces sp. NPDC048392]|uniref:DUF397 domain-containing protein n=1 Tax=Streptomyces sp. NPDC048392 TaxID=3365543 RepID=UPI0037240E34